jgi:nucleoside-diphosphate-sugar epimerase
MRVLVAGATGAIGRQLVPRLVAAGHEVEGEENPLGPTPVREMRAMVAAIRHFEEAVLGADWTEGIVLRYVAEWLPALARILGAKKPMQAPRLAAGEAGAVLMTEIRGASNAKAKRELGWQPAHPSWRQGFAT